MSRYTVDLLNVGPKSHDSAEEGFETVKYFDHDSDLQKSTDCIEHVKRQKYSIVWFPDVGMSWPSVYLANYRLAPIQVCFVCCPLCAYVSTR